MCLRIIYSYQSGQREEAWELGRLFVDGYNVIRRDPALRQLERRNPSSARAELLRLLGHHSLSRYQVTVVFDGAAPRGERLSAGRVKVIHSRSEKADALIASMCGLNDVVVTDDRGLAEDTLPGGPVIWSVTRLMETVRPPARGKSQQHAAEEKPLSGSPKLRGFDVCPKCMFYRRDDWIMLCVEDGEVGRPKNFREHW